MNYILSIDCGVSTGIALIGYEPDSAPTLEGAWQFSGGVAGLKKWVSQHFNLDPDISGEHLDDTQYFFHPWHKPTVICEKFNARNNGSFGYTTASLEPLRCEGALIALGLMPDYDPKEKRYRDPKLQYLVGGKDLAEKKRRQHAFLKNVGFYRTNKDFPDSPSKDGADDFRSACAHGLAYLAREVGHKPTWDLIRGWGEND